MYILIYRWRVHSGREQQFIAAWSRLTALIREREGGLGSRLHLAEDGTYVAYAQWPSRAVWEASKAIAPNEEVVALRALMREIAELQKPDVRMNVVDDKLELIGAGATDEPDVAGPGPTS